MGDKALGLLVLGCLLGACSGRTSLSPGQVEEGGSPGLAPPPPLPLAGSGSAPVASPTGPTTPPGPAPLPSAGGAPSVGVGGSPSHGATAGVGGASAPSEAGAGGGGADDEFPPHEVCGPEVNEFTKGYCPYLDSLSLELGAIQDAGGDGQVSPGEEAIAVFVVNNSGPDNFVAGPCIGMVPATAGLTVLEQPNPGAQTYGVNVGMPAKLRMHFRVEPDVMPGTRIPLLAWIDVHGALCPNTRDLRFELRVAP